jgi:type II secretory pathway pseudopilin PulG
MPRRVDGCRVLKRLRTDETGFGLVELTFSMVLLSISLLALVAAFTSGAVTLKRAARVATATALGERQMELYRGLKYDSIGLQSGLVTAADSVWTAGRPTGTGFAVDTVSCTDATKPECRPTQSVDGPDGRGYRIDSYVMTVPVSATHTYKLVRVIVRDAETSTGVLAQLQSTFDQSTGL